MDKRKNKILIGCLALLLVMTVGYALFSENITINGTATAKGEFDINASCQPGLIEDLKTKLGLPSDGGYRNDTCTANNNEVNLSTVLDYPTAIRYFTIKLTNDGTIDAKISADAILDLENFKKQPFCLIDKQTNEETCSEASVEDSVAFEPIGVEDENSNIYSIDDEEIADFTDGNGTIIIKPNQSLFVLAILNWLDDGTEFETEFFKLYDVKSYITKEFVFEQYMQNN